MPLLIPSLLFLYPFVLPRRHLRHPTSTPAVGSSSHASARHVHAAPPPDRRQHRPRRALLLCVPRGRHAVRLDNDAEISQEFPVEKGSIYSVTFCAARTCVQLESLNVSVLPASQTIDLQTLYNV